MLSERLRGRELFSQGRVPVGTHPSSKQIKAVVLLEKCINRLVLTMRTVETLGLYSREDVEETILYLLESNEDKYYGMSESEFRHFLRRFLRK